eukprot:CAMPEP_0115357212 /NCGR_PEP_ID=MMETSP0270-20121206/100030_1 /TAXON_ID=71861 /ORGANISM="Scrippsiella trochoidea, Strain CCMP3099" /LENGTH=211 /DNA_ID=CAMNT_0002779659 /DNA_START=134 /DNA_END=765 /DNA_ORIENTATION=-
MHALRSLCWLLLTNIGFSVPVAYLCSGDEVGSLSVSSFLHVLQAPFGEVDIQHCQSMNEPAVGATKSIFKLMQTLSMFGLVLYSLLQAWWGCSGDTVKVVARRERALRRARVVLECASTKFPEYPPPLNLLSSFLNKVPRASSATELPPVARLEQDGRHKEDAASEDQVRLRKEQMTQLQRDILQDVEREVEEVPATTTTVAALPKASLSS